MLVLSRKPDEGFFIGDDIEVVILKVEPNAVRIGISAPANMRILREELVGLPDTKKVLAGKLGPSESGGVKMDRPA